MDLMTSSRHFIQFIGLLGHAAAESDGRDGGRRGQRQLTDCMICERAAHICAVLYSGPR